MIKVDKVKVKRVLIIVVVVLLSAYFLWDISLKLVSVFRSQGYQLALVDISRQASNEECLPVNIMTEQGQLNLINVSCLQNQEEIIQE
jgi:hypothetical protein